MSIVVEMGMKPVKPRWLWRHALMPTTLLIAPVAAFDRAEADCLSASSASGTTVDCSGATNNPAPGGANGYGNDNHNTYNIPTGAKVQGDVFGILGVVEGAGMSARAAPSPPRAASAPRSDTCFGLAG